MKYHIWMCQQRLTTAVTITIIPCPTAVAGPLLWGEIEVEACEMELGR